LPYPVSRPGLVGTVRTKPVKRECRKLGNNKRFKTQLVVLGRSQRQSGRYDQAIYTIDDQADEPSRFIGYNLFVRQAIIARRVGGYVDRSCNIATRPVHGVRG